MSSGHAGDMYDASRSKAPDRDRPGSWIPLAVVVCVLAIAACASSAEPSHQSQYDRQLAFSKCMRANGVPNFPDPGLSISGPSNGIGGIEIPTTINVQAPAFQAAEKACAKLQPGAVVSASSPSASAERAALAWARCIRKHGVPNFPGPLPTADQGLIYRGLVFPVAPGLNFQSPAEKQATAACGVGP